MSKLSESINKQKEKLKEMSKAKKIALGIISSVAIITLITITVIILQPKYVVLFSNMTPEDSGAIINNLKEKKTKYKIKDNSILVEKKSVDQLRMELLSEVSFKEGSHGFELFDNSKIAPTDKESKIMYQRALSGELERTIKSFAEVENAKVNLVIPDKSAFITKPAPATASVTLILSKGKELSEDQVRAIVALVSGSVENLPKENVAIVADGFKLLTEDLFNEEKNAITKSTDKQLAAKKQIEEEYEKKIMNVLEPIYKEKVRVSVNADLNFDAVQQNKLEYDKDGAVVSQHEVTDSNNTEGNNSGSPVDNNMNNNQNTDANGENVTHKENTTNYELSKVEETVIKAPGQVERVSASIVVDGAIDNQTRTSINNLVSEAIGFNRKRGDSITVEALQFNTVEKDLAEKELEAMKEAERIAKRNKLIYMGIFGLAAIIILAIVISAIRKSKQEEEEVEVPNFDMIIGDDVKPKEIFETLNLEAESEKEHVANEVRKYASNKPEQVADIVKSWLAEDERG
ncbi:flagellar M-ring protein FliF [Clostridium argentinense CDC 2741]|uniref:Flagellar M-ring protein n=1 Tax=Clostridium argentinense CDC 2741 TaxID=1418104 RepID=A0A0C1U686_9CLOT|nr:flagellar basal-body MS-ring/collar protein FliF [Clostridium argentinense]ARC85306.1 flagellar M-ring protein FliF [Clostridium argentinense]KIE47283.1 flagellar M-ring protein FliF [Clostridium argentinense CDC 2741]NFF40928.1 flagellar M-ring protein FliF [Clostridium argentinense]NFP51361.1 flagellar M-ring protein FliF [Clostridium argentinense]NFP73399.1 flagellar M-ring protein FliF [Clostridium argentinense]